MRYYGIVQKLRTSLLFTLIVFERVSLIIGFVIVSSNGRLLVTNEAQVTSLPAGRTYLTPSKMMVTK